MSQLLEWREGLCRWLASGESFDGVTVAAEFPARPQAAPLEHPQVAVGFESLTAEQGGQEEYLGIGPQGEGRAVRRIQAVLRLELLSPPAQGGGGCHALWEALLERLLLAAGEYQVERLWCGPITYDQTSGGYRVAGRAKLTLTLAAPVEGTCYEAVELRRRKK